MEKQALLSMLSEQVRPPKVEQVRVFTESYAKYSIIFIIEYKLSLKVLFLRLKNRRKMVKTRSSFAMA
jgi:hypothetical protein